MDQRQRRKAASHCWPGAVPVDAAASEATAADVTAPEEKRSTTADGVREALDLSIGNPRLIFLMGKRSLRVPNARCFENSFFYKPAFGIHERWKG
jgi:hypothetical protein